MLLACSSQHKYMHINTGNTIYKNGDKLLVKF